MFTVGLESCPDQSRAGASNAMSTPSNPWRSSSSAQEVAEGLVQVREHRVERHVDGQHVPTLTVMRAHGVKNAG